MTYFFNLHVVRVVGNPIITIGEFKYLFFKIRARSEGMVLSGMGRWWLWMLGELVSGGRVGDGWALCHALGTFNEWIVCACRGCVWIGCI